MSNEKEELFSKFPDKGWDCGLKKLLPKNGSTGSADRIKESVSQNREKIRKIM